MVNVIEYDPAVPMGNITVPIPETISVQKLSKYLIFSGTPILYIGQAGCGKTQMIKGLLQDIARSTPSSTTTARSTSTTTPTRATCRA